MGNWLRNPLLRCGAGAVFGLASRVIELFSSALFSHFKEIKLKDLTAEFLQL